MKVSELKHKPQELPCCEICEHKNKGVKFCVQEEKCVDILIHNDLIKSPNSLKSKQEPERGQSTVRLYG